MPTAIAIAQIIATLAPLVQQALERGSDITDAELAAAAAQTDALYAQVQAAVANAAKG